MTRRLCVAPVLVLALAACTAAGEDVDVKQSSSASTSCSILPGEDVCANPAKYIEPTSANGALAATQAIVEFSGIAHAAAHDLTAACTGVVHDLGLTTPAFSAETSGEDRMRTTCKLAIDLIVERKAALGGTLAVTVTPPTCTPKPTPAPWCAADDGTARTSASKDVHDEAQSICTPPLVSTSVQNGADDARLKRAIEKNYPTVYAFKSRLEGMAKLTGTIAGSSSALGTARAACIPTLALLASDSVALVSRSASVTSDLDAALR